MRSVGTALVKLIVTATSGLVSFTTNVIRPVKVVCEFSPIQEGTGDPSPDNVRPIGGWTGCEVYHTGKNMWWTDYTYNDPGGAIKKNGEFIATNKGITTTYLLGGSSENNRINFKLPKGTYSLSAYSETFSGMHLLFTDGSTWYPRTTKTFDKDMIVQAVRCNTARLAVGTYLWKIQIEQGAEYTDYEPYQGATLPITFTDPDSGDPLTVYGGSITLNEDGSSDLVVINFGRLASSLTWEVNRNYSNTFNGAGFTNRKLSIDGSNARGCYCDTYQWYTSTEVGAQTAGIALANANTGNLANRSRIYVKDSRFSAVGDFVASFATHDPLIVCPLATPATYHFDSIGQLQSFIGTNNIWHNMNGGITAEYWNKQ